MDARVIAWMRHAGCMRVEKASVEEVVSVMNFRKHHQIIIVGALLVGWGGGGGRLLVLARALPIRMVKSAVLKLCLQSPVVIDCVAEQKPLTHTGVVHCSLLSPMLLLPRVACSV